MQPTSEEQDSMISTERVALVVFHLCHGRMISTAQIAQITGLSPTGVWRMMAKISRTIPVYQQDGLWVLLDVDK